MTTPKYQTEFPDFDPSELPIIPLEWEDVSWHNDTCPSWEAADRQFRVFVDYLNPAQREVAGRVRFSVGRCLTPGGELQQPPYVLDTDDWQTVLTYVAAPIDRIAVEFAILLRADMTLNDWNEMRRRNSSGTYDPISCASHDFLDANVVMAAAFRAILGRKSDPGSELDAAIWSEAWARAKTQFLTVPAGQANERARARRIVADIPIALGTAYHVHENEHGYTVTRLADSATATFSGDDDVEMFRDNWTGDECPDDPASAEQAAAADFAGGVLEAWRWTTK